MAIGFTNIGNGGGLKGLTATPNDVKQGLTFSRDGKTVESGTLNLNNLRPENIKAGVNIGGIVGTMIEGVVISAERTSLCPVEKTITYYPAQTYMRDYIYFTKFSLVSVAKGHVKISGKFSKALAERSCSHLVYLSDKVISSGSMTSDPEYVNYNFDFILPLESGKICKIVTKNSSGIEGPLKITFYLPDSNINIQHHH